MCVCVHTRLSRGAAGPMWRLARRLAQQQLVTGSRYGGGLWALQGQHDAGSQALLVNLVRELVGILTSGVIFWAVCQNARLSRTARNHLLQTYVTHILIQTSVARMHDRKPKGETRQQQAGLSQNPGHWYIPYVTGYVACVGHDPVTSI